MSEVLTITGGHQGTTYGTLAAATSYMQTHYGSAYTAWLGLSADDQKRTLIAFTDYLDRQAWNADADTFAKRDAIAAFPKATYEGAALLAEDDALISDLESGTDLQSVSSSGVSVSFRDRASGGAALVLPPIVAQYLAKYLVTIGSGTLESLASDATNPFADADDYDRTEPF